jgi:hypothetical protein
MRKTKPSAHSLIESLGREEASLQEQEFLAPLLSEGRARLRLQNLVYEVAVANAAPGWWCCRLCDARSAVVVDEALPWQRGDYLALWPALRMVLLEPLRNSTEHAWLALPYNPSDARQRFGLVGPRIVRLLEGGQPFERIIARVEGSTLWYDEPDRRADPATAETLREGLAAEHATPPGASLGAGEQAAYHLLLEQRLAARAAAEAARHAAEAETARRAAALDPTERNLRHALEMGGARLIGYEQSRGGLRVTWERNGQRSVTLVDHDLSVVSAGICLSGQDRRFDLTSIVGVVLGGTRDDDYE